MTPYLLERRLRLCGIEVKETSKKEEDLKAYKKLVKEMLIENPKCEINLTGCSGAAEGLHHKKGRGVHLLNKKFLIRACNSCHRILEDDPQFAIDNGFSISRHKI